jgi:23S rRNA pseudouridine2605 synthase
MTDAPEHQSEASQQEIASEAQEVGKGEAAAASKDPALASLEEAIEKPAEGESSAEQEPEFPIVPRPASKLERLQKILAQAGVASRRHAEELITQGRVQVNGQVVKVLGSKADPARDHIRVDGKLLHGAERLRYFMLNKPKGYVTTVADPEGRPTVMEFFSKTGGRLYPVGRLDYQSEGLLLVTNDGELANGLTKAASGVEKTYLVKVAGQPSEQMLDRLREGVAIERGKPGEGKVRTAPARVRQVRQGDNPWYEVVLIEGRNRELRKMFEEIGHHVEKIRRVGYGPLVLDLEPGKLRELEAEEVAALRLAAEGKLRKPKAKESRQRKVISAQLPTVTPRPSPKPVKAVGEKPAVPEYGAARPPRPFETRKTFGGEKPIRATGGLTGAGPRKFGSVNRPADRPASRSAWKKDDRGPRSSGPPRERPEWKRDAPPGRPFGTGPAASKPTPHRSGPRDRPSFQRSAPPRQEPPVHSEGPSAKSPSRLRIEAVEPGQAPFNRSQTNRLTAGRSGPRRTSGDRPSSPVRTGAGAFGGTGARPTRAPGRSRPSTTSTGKPRVGGARPSSKHAGRAHGGGGDPRPASGGGGGTRSAGKAGWKPKPAFGSKPETGGFSKPKFGGKGNANRGGKRSSGPRPGGKRGSGAPGRGKRG